MPHFVLARIGHRSTRSDRIGRPPAVNPKRASCEILSSKGSAGTSTGRNVPQREQTDTLTEPRSDPCGRTGGRTRPLAPQSNDWQRRQKAPANGSLPIADTPGVMRSLHPSGAPATSTSPPFGLLNPRVKFGADDRAHRLIKHKILSYHGLCRNSVINGPAALVPTALHTCDSPGERGPHTSAMRVSHA